MLRRHEVEQFLDQRHPDLHASKTRSISSPSRTLYMIHHQGGKYVSFRNMLRRHEVEQFLDQRVRVESSEALMRVRVRRELHEMLGGARLYGADEPQLSSCTHVPAAAYG